MRSACVTRHHKQRLRLLPPSVAACANIRDSKIHFNRCLRGLRCRRIAAMPRVVYDEGSKACGMLCLNDEQMELDHAMRQHYRCPTQRDLTAQHAQTDIHPDSYVESFCCRRLGIAYLLFPLPWGLPVNHTAPHHLVIIDPTDLSNSGQLQLLIHALRLYARKAVAM